MTIEHESWIVGTTPIEDAEELKRVEGWLKDFASEEELWRVAWRLLRTCKRHQNLVEKACLSDARSGDVCPCTGCGKAVVCVGEGIQFCLTCGEKETED